MTPAITLDVVWVLWVFSWVVAARWSNPATKRPAAGEERLYRFLTFGGGVLLFARFGRLFPGAREHGTLVDDGLVAVAVAGFSFAWWARLHLGLLWSSSVTRKADHRVIDTGPYAIVRHPIYTGLLLAIFATALLKGAPVRFVGAILMTSGFWIKARLEERFLREELGAGAYDAYRRRVPMLMPFWPASR